LLPTRTLVHRAIWAIAVLFHIDDPFPSLASSLQESMQAETLSREYPRAIALDEYIGFVDKFKHFSQVVLVSEISINCTDASVQG
jgi:hypothetical protein